MEPFDITITATLRPELLKITLDSFHDNLFGEWLDYAHIYINVDKAGCENEDEAIWRLELIAGILADLMPRDSYTINVKEPHFPRAFLWCMKSTKNKLVFHLEEDWQLEYPLDFEKMYGCFYKYPNLKHLRLSCFRSTEDTLKMWQRHFSHWNGDFFLMVPEARIPVGWCGHPSLNDGGWLRSIAEYLNPERNPEKQFHYNPEIVDKFIVKSDFGLFHPQNHPSIMKDIGRSWMRENEYKKVGGINAEWFTHWERVERET